MKRSLAHALWITVALAGCGTNKATAPNTGKTAAVDSPVSAQPSTDESLDLAESPADRVANSAADSKATERESAEQPAPPPVAQDPAAMPAEPKAEPPVLAGKLGTKGSGSASATSTPMPTTPRPAGSSTGAAAVGRTRGGAVAVAGPMKPTHAKMKRQSQGLIAGEGPSSEDYTDYGINEWTVAKEDRLSTFAVDVDTASYAIARRKIHEGQLPPPSAVRVEEFVNYFNYGYSGPTDDKPFAVHMDASPSPFTADRHIFRVGVAAKKLSIRERKPANLVFLVDVSGSMSSPDKLGLAKRALRILVDNLKDSDHVSLVTYAGNTRVVLEPTGLENKGKIVTAIEDLTSGGSTAMSSGIQLAYDLAAKNLGPNSLSRVIVMSDGDANVGATSHDTILKTISSKVKEGVTLSTIGFGMGNYKDTMMEQLANKGNGNYYYIDSLSQAKRVFQEQIGGTLEVVAKDVKIQVDFDPEAVKQYRLVGYENRDIADVDFRNDKVDAGEIGAGHMVTAIYELELANPKASFATVRIRHKAPRGTTASENAYAFANSMMAESFDLASADFRFATAVMATAELLRKSKSAAGWRLDKVAAIARGANDGSAERTELVDLLSRISGMRETVVIR